MASKTRAKEVRLLTEIADYCHRLLAIDPKDVTATTILDAAQQELRSYDNNRTTSKRRKQ